MVSNGTLFAFTLVCVGILVLRKTAKNLERPFKTPLVPFVPIMGILVCILMMASLPIESWERLAVWLGIGLLIYFVYGKKHSVIRKQHQNQQ